MARLCRCNCFNVDFTKKHQRILSLCTGYGGLELGLIHAGVNVRTVAYVEIEALAAFNLAKKVEAGHLPAAPIWSDLKTLPVQKFRGLVDGVIGGYPCTPFSNAGKKQRESDPRHLWDWFAKTIRVVQPRWVFLENVEGHITKGLRNVLHELGELGFRSTWGIYSASETGLPHQRKRVFILAYARSAGLEGLLRESTEGGWQAERSATGCGPVGGDGWSRVVFASECDGYPDEGCVCPVCDDEYTYCACPGPCQDDIYEYTERDGFLYARARDRAGNFEFAPVAGPREQQHEWEPPRVIEPEMVRGIARPTDRVDYGELQTSVDNKTDELLMLGNGVVPATASTAWRDLWKQLI